MPWQLELDELVSATGGKKLSDPCKTFTGVGTDTRTPMPKNLFIPLKGENYDAHEFIKEALTQGAQGVLVHEWREEWKPLLSLASFVQVPDTLKALQNLGKYWRRKHKFRVIAISGSNGKTSTKEFSFALVRKYFPTHASKGSLNNHWGVPLSILQAAPEHKVLILEMGMNHSGELTTLTGIAEPDVVAVTMVGRSHIGELGSQEKIAKAKEEMYVSCPKAVQIFNLDNDWTWPMYERATRLKTAEAILAFSEEDPRADVRFKVESISLAGLTMKARIRADQRTLTVKVFGRHNVINLMTATCIALSLDVPIPEIWKNLGELNNSSWGRNQIVELQNGTKVLFDAYNANPDSMAAMLDNISEIEHTGKRYLVLGDMLELGAYSASAHKELGEKVGKLGVNGILYQGKFAADFAQGLKSRAPMVSCKDFDENIAKKFAAPFRRVDLIAMKGSRGMKLERILKAWNPVGFVEKS